MTSLESSAVIFGCVFGGAVLGVGLKRLLPSHHLSNESKEVVRLGVGLVGTMTALLLGLLVASAKATYDTNATQVLQISAKLEFLDRLLTGFGPDAAPVRGALRESTEKMIAQMWPEGSAPVDLNPVKAGGAQVMILIQKLEPQNELQKYVKSEAISIATDIAQLRALLHAQGSVRISLTFLVCITAWLTVTFASYGLFAPANLTVVATLLLCALSVACALLLVLELSRPFDGLIQIQKDSMLLVLQQMAPAK
ncbi:MAG: hypothetical protein JSS51_13315 [Planctomycetes bacterium]|nr:hypothetical protein [Planctomycetota bacterium]